MVEKKIALQLGPKESERYLMPECVNQSHCPLFISVGSGMLSGSLPTAANLPKASNENKIQHGNKENLETLVIQ